MFSTIHITLGFSAIVFGFFVLTMQKGTKLHRILASIYIVSILGINSTSFTITSLTGSYGVFHILAILNLVTTLLGVITIKLGSIQSHYHLMFWSYAGLMAATINQAFANISWLTALREQYPLINFTIIIPMFLLTFILLLVNENKMMKKYDPKLTE